MYCNKILSLIVTCGLWLLAVLPVEAGETQRRIVQPVRQSIDTLQATQQAEEQWRQEKERLVARLEQLQEKEKKLTEQKKTLNDQVASARNRINAKKKQLADIEEVSAQISPFIDEMFNALKLQVTEGAPFLADERQARIHRLESILADPNVDISEKYRKVMESVLVEAEYGFTIETYQETITIDGQAMLANIFRLGRISLFYQSLDGRDCGFFNTADGIWQRFDAKHNRAIQMAIDIAAKRRPIELLTLPVGRMVAK